MKATTFEGSSVGWPPCRRNGRREGLRQWHLRLPSEGSEMPARRLNMRKIQEVLRLLLVCGLRQRQASLACGVGRTSVAEYLERAQKAGLLEAEWQGWRVPAAPLLASRQHGRQLLAAEPLLDPPVWIVGLGDIGDRLAQPGPTPREIRISAREMLISRAEISISAGEILIFTGEIPISPREIPISPGEILISAGEIFISGQEISISPPEILISAGEISISWA